MRDKHHQDACAVAYADDSYIKAKLSVALEVLSDIKHVLKEDAGLALNDDRSFIVLTETKFSFRCIPVWDRYSPHRTRVEKKTHVIMLSP